MGPQQWVVVGGAGFIGSHFCRALKKRYPGDRLIVIDNLSAGTKKRIYDVLLLDDVEFCELDVVATSAVKAVVPRGAVVVNFASNPNIAAGAEQPTLDFFSGTLLAQSVLEAARLAGASRYIYASGSGVYGDRGKDLCRETDRLEPFSPYGASKASGEHLARVYAEMFGLRASVFRFGNVVGPMQTHGVGFDFLRALIGGQKELRVQGDGSQSKPYVWVEDVLEAIFLAYEKEVLPFAVFNVGTDDYLTVRDIAYMAVEIMDLPASFPIEWGTSPKGWEGDIPVVRLDTSRIRQLGWSCSLSSREAMGKSLAEMREAMVLNVL